MHGNCRIYNRENLVIGECGATWLRIGRRQGPAGATSGRDLNDELGKKMQEVRAV